MRVGWFAYQLISHKVLRWLAPVFMLLMLFSAGVIAWMEFSMGNDGAFVVFLGLQLAGYLLAAMYLVPPLRHFRLVYIAYYFLVINVAAAVGLGLLASGRTIGTWKPQR